MNIYLYKNRSEKEKLEKILASEEELYGFLRDESSVIEPVFKVETDLDLSRYNYAEIPAFHRYYYVTDMIVLRTGLWELHLAVDVLMSFRSDIYALDVILSDSETSGANNYLSGEQWRSTVKTKTDILNFSNGLLDTGEYILITAGG